MYGPHRRFASLLPHTLRRISQAASAIATNTSNMPERINILAFQYRKR